jgi:hypothetical protein
MSHEQFLYASAPKVFGGCHGAGPLLAALDTNVVIDITEQLELIDHFGAGILQPDGWRDPTAALADLIAVWFWRDVRFFVPPSILSDTRGSGLAPGACALDGRRLIPSPPISGNAGDRRSPKGLGWTTARHP